MMMECKQVHQLKFPCQLKMIPWNKFDQTWKQNNSVSSIYYMTNEKSVHNDTIQHPWMLVHSKTLWSYDVGQSVSQLFPFCDTDFAAVWVL